jgi:hypothetical protein
MCVVKCLSPQYSQVTVGCTAARVATKLDVKCVNSSGDIVLIENKIGFANYYEIACGVLKAPYEGTPSTARNHHQLQLAFTKALHDRQFSVSGIKIKRSNCFVWRFTEDGVTEYPLERWAEAGVNTTLMAMSL